MKYSAKFTLEIPMSEFYKMATSDLPKRALHEAIKYELYQSWHGVVYGDCVPDDWKEIFYKNLFKQGIIKQTKKSISEYGEFYSR